MSRPGTMRAAAFEIKGLHPLIYLLVLTSSILSAASVSQGQSITATGKFELTDKASPRTKDLSKAVVWLTPVGETGDPAEVRNSHSSQRLQLVQKNKSFSPHVLVVQVGAPVEFPNH